MFPSSSLVFIGTRVFILDTCIVFSWDFFRTPVSRLQVCIVFAGFVEARAPILEAYSTCFLTGSLYRLRCWVSGAPFLIYFFLGVFGASFLILEVCIGLADFCQGMCPQAISLYRFQLVYIEMWPRENYRPIASHWQTLSHNVVSSEIRSHNFSGDRHESDYNAITTPSLFIVLSVEYICKSKAKKNDRYLKELMSFNDTRIVCYTKYFRSVIIMCF